MIIRSAANIVSQTHTGNLTIPANRDRSYFFIIMTSTSGTLKLGKGSGAVPLANGVHYEPYVCPTGELEITTAGTFIVVMG
jgi:hypothetical protein